MIPGVQVILIVRGADHGEVFHLCPSHFTKLPEERFKKIGVTNQPCQECEKSPEEAA